MSTTSNGSGSPGSHSRSSSASVLAFPEVLNIAIEFEEFATRLSLQVQSLSRRLEDWHERNARDRVRIQALEARTRTVDALETRQREDQAHIQVLERKVEALSSEVQFLRWQQGLGGIISGGRDDVDQLAGTSRRDDLDAMVSRHVTQGRTSYSDPSFTTIKVEPDEIDPRTGSKEKGKEMQRSTEHDVDSRHVTQTRTSYSDPSSTTIKVEPDEIDLRPGSKGKEKERQRSTEHNIDFRGRTRASNSNVSGSGASTSSTATIKVEPDETGLHTPPNRKDKGKGKEKQRSRSMERSSRHGSGDFRRDRPLKVSSGNNSNNTKATTTRHEDLAYEAMTSAGSSTSSTVKAIKKEPIEVDVPRGKNRKTFERTSSWVDTQASSSSSSSSRHGLSSDPVAIKAEPSNAADTHLPSRPTEFVSRTTSWDMVEGGSQGKVEIEDEDELRQLSELSRELDLQSPFASLDSVSATPAGSQMLVELYQQKDENVETEAELKPYDLDSDTDESDEEFFETGSEAREEPEEPEIRYVGIRHPPHASPVAIGGFKGIREMLNLPPNVHEQMTLFAIFKGPRFHVLFHEDMAFLYTPFAIEVGTEHNPVSILSGWCYKDEVQQEKEYIDAHVPPGGKTYHTFALYKRQRLWWYLGAMVWKPSSFKSGHGWPREEDERIHGELSSAWNRGLGSAEVADAFANGELEEVCVELSRAPDAKEVSMDFAKVRLQYIKAECANIWL